MSALSFASVLWSGCADAPYIELIIADERLPLLTSARDYDALGVEAQKDNCANTRIEYPPAALPATLSVVPGVCFDDEVALQAFATLNGLRVAESKWQLALFPEEGALVVTATLTNLSSRELKSSE